MAGRTVIVQFFERRCHGPGMRTVVPYEENSMKGLLEASTRSDSDRLGATRGAPGPWHEPCLEDQGDPIATQELAATVYTVTPGMRAGQSIVVVGDNPVIECLVARPAANDVHAKHTRHVAEILTVPRFECRYGFGGIGVRPRQRVIQESHP